jgi:hypothetical protein
MRPTLALTLTLLAALLIVALSGWMALTLN